jgi:hypothetical protein
MSAFEGKADIAISPRHVGVSQARAQTSPLSNSIESDQGLGASFARDLFGKAVPAFRIML